jgi:hypothetical protein
MDKRVKKIKNGEMLPLTGLWRSIGLCVVKDLALALRSGRAVPPQKHYFSASGSFLLEAG